MAPPGSLFSRRSRSLPRRAVRALLTVIPLVGAIGLGGCAGGWDTRELLLRSAREQDPQFPERQSGNLTRFAYLGRVQTPEGLVHVVEQSAVIAGPNGLVPQRRIVYFDHDMNWIGTDSALAVPRQPLVCSGSLLLLEGPPGPRSWDDDLPPGNALDFSSGFVSRRLVSVKGYSGQQQLADAGAPEGLGQAQARLGKWEREP